MIPKILHFIWLGKKQIPIHFNKFLDEWKSNYSDYEVIVWNDDMVEQKNLIPDNLKKYYFSDLPEAFRADIARYIILNKYGGFYFDVDFQFLKKIPDHFLNFKFLGGIQNNGEVAIGFFASQINNDLLTETIDSIPNSINIAIQENYYTGENLYRITGPEFFNKICLKYLSNTDYFFFTKEYFYPYWFDEKHRRYEQFDISSPLSYAVHHWEKSWGVL
jgi:mannosyltransferase OCH1-like enzyme